MRPGDRDPIDCDEAVRRLAAWLDGELKDAHDREVRRHLELCRSCFSRAEFERRLRERIRSELRPSTVSPEFRTRIVALLADFAAADERPGPCQP